MQRASWADWVSLARWSQWQAKKPSPPRSFRRSCPPCNMARVRHGPLAHRVILLSLTHLRRAQLCPPAIRLARTPPTAFPLLYPLCIEQHPPRPARAKEPSSPRTQRHLRTRPFIVAKSRRSVRGRDALSGRVRRAAPRRVALPAAEGCPSTHTSTDDDAALVTWRRGRGRCPRRTRLQP